MDSITNDSILCRSDDIVSREIEGELIIVPIASGIGDMEEELYSLNETGRAFWDLIDGRRSVGDIAVDLEKNYDIPVNTILTDLVGLAGELVKRRILIVH